MAVNTKELWERGTLITLLVEIKNYAAIMELSTEVSQAIKGALLPTANDRARLFK